MRLAALVALLLFALPTWAQGTATLNWMATTERTDGSPVELSGYKVYWGTDSGGYGNSADVADPSITTYVVENLAGCTTYYFAVTAIDTDGLESDFSNEDSKRIGGCAPPRPPTLIEVIIAWLHDVIRSIGRWFV